MNPHIISILLIFLILFFAEEIFFSIFKLDQKYLLSILVSVRDFMYLLFWKMCRVCTNARHLYVILLK